MAVAALPMLAQNLDPEKAIEFIKAAESAAAEARSIAWKAIHSASLTEKEEYIGWLPLSLLLYKLWIGFLAPQVEFGIQTQIGLADIMNTFGANIDTSRMYLVLNAVQKSTDPFGLQAKAQAQAEAKARAAQRDRWEVGPHGRG